MYRRDSQVGLASDYNDLVTSGTGQVAFWQAMARPTLMAWQNTAFTDQNSLGQDPRFVDYDGADDLLGYINPVQDGRDDDFHLQSSATDGTAPGSCHGGMVAPVLDAGTGLPVLLAGTWTIDGHHSPCIDRGDPTDGYANEPVPNGGYRNLGAYGNTAQASTSPAEFVMVTRPDGGEVWPAEQTFPIRWRSTPVGYSLDNPYRTTVLGDGAVAYWRLG